MHAKELVISLLLTVVFLFISFVGSTRLSTIQIVDKWGESHVIHISYYGFPFEMIAILNPIGTMEEYWVNNSAASLFQMVGGGLFLNFILYFSLAFVIVYLFKRLRS